MKAGQLLAVAGTCCPLANVSKQIDLSVRARAELQERDKIRTVNISLAVSSDIYYPRRLYSRWRG